MLDFIQRQTDWYKIKTTQITTVRRNLAKESGKLWIEFDFKLIDNFSDRITQIYLAAKRTTLPHFLKALYR